MSYSRQCDIYPWIIDHEKGNDNEEENVYEELDGEAADADQGDVHDPVDEGKDDADAEKGDADDGYLTPNQGRYTVVAYSPIEGTISSQ